MTNKKHNRVTTALVQPAPPCCVLLSALSSAPTRARESLHESALHLLRHASFSAPLCANFARYEHVKCPCGSGSVQFCVTPSFVITTFAVADPSYVIVSVRLVVVGVCPLIVTVDDE